MIDIRLSLVQNGVDVEREVGGRGFLTFVEKIRSFIVIHFSSIFRYFFTGG